MDSTAGLVRDQRNAMIASFLGWTLDAFDFVLVVMAAPDIGKTFHKSKAEVAFALTLTLAFRPVGAFIFGLLADRYGRRLPLMVDLIFFSIVEVATGLAPNFGVFLVLRALFGIGMGGEWGVGASLAMEKVPSRWRGVLSGLLQQGYSTGWLLAALAYGVIAPRYGWQALFFIGGIPALLALFVRYGVKESAVWEKTREVRWDGIWSAIASHWKIFLLMTLLMALMNLSSHGTMDNYRGFLLQDFQYSPQRVAKIIAFSMVGAILGGIVFGLFSDRIGRRKSMGIAFVGALLCIPLWAYAHTPTALAAGAFLLQFMVQGAWGVIPAHLSELSPGSLRGLFPGFAYQCGNLLASPINTLQPALVDHYHTSYANVMAFSAVFVFLIALVVLATGREKHGVAFGQGG